MATRGGHTLPNEKHWDTPAEIDDSFTIPIAPVLSTTSTQRGSGLGSSQDRIPVIFAIRVRR